MITRRGWDKTNVLFKKRTLNETSKVYFGREVEYRFFIVKTLCSSLISVAKFRTRLFYISFKICTYFLGLQTSDKGKLY